MGTSKSSNEQGSGVASAADNAKLKHAEGGTTTRNDQLDAGVPMAQGHPSEPQGPEDALGRGKKRGDYTDRVPGQPHESVPTRDGGQPVTATTKYVDANGNEQSVESVVDLKPTSTLEPQRPRTEEQGDVRGKKGGVDTAR